MIYRKEDYQATESVAGQTFPTVKSVYRLNKIKNVLEETNEKVDIVALVQSSISSCLSSILDRFLFPTQETADGIAEDNKTLDKLDLLQEAFETSQELKRRYGFDENLSMEDTFSKVIDLREKVAKHTQFLEDQGRQVKEKIKKEESDYVEEEKKVN